MKRTRNIAFIVEMLLLFVILLFVIVTITRTFMTSRSQSLHARHLTEAVSLAEDLAEVTRGTGDQTAAIEQIEMMEEARGVMAADAQTIRTELEFAGTGGSRDLFAADIRREEEDTAAGRFVTEYITVFCVDEAESLYELTTGWYMEK